MAQILRTLSVAVILTYSFLIGCHKSNNSSPQEMKTFSGDTIFERQVFATQAECQQVRQQTPWFNCTQNVDFRSDGTVLMLVTDIMNAGTYNISGKTITLTFDSAGDVANEVKFEIVSDTEIKDSSGNVWSEKSAQ